MENRTVSIVLVMFAAVGLITLAAAAPLHAEMTTADFCQLSIQHLELQIPQTRELIAIVEQYLDDPEELAYQLGIKRAQFDGAKMDLYASFDTTAEDYLAYMARNAKAVNAYLEANPSIKQQIDDLSAQLEVLMGQENALMQTPAPEEDPLPVTD